MGFYSGGHVLDTYNFHDNQKSIQISKPDLPSPWINYLSNGSLHAFISQAGGGMLWWKDPIVYRLTRYRMHNLPIDSPGFYVYIRMKDGEVWSPTFRPCNTSLDKWSAIHAPGKTEFIAQKGNLEARLTFFITPDYDTLVWDLKLLNENQEQIEVDVFFYSEFSQFLWKTEEEAGYYFRHMLKTWYDKEFDSLFYYYHFNGHPHIEDVPLVYFASTEEVASYCGDRDAFMGNYRDERNPIAVENGNCGNKDLHTGEPCGAIQNHVTLEGGSEKCIRVFLGVVPGALKNYQQAKSTAKQQLEQLRKPETIDIQLDKLNKWWSDHLNVLTCNIPDENAQRQINIWSPINCVHTGRYSRNINTNAPGVRGVGFRDTCQDMLAVAYRKPEWAEEMFLTLLSKQFEKGCTVHSYHPYENKSPDTKLCSDNHLWLPLLAYAITAETGDMTMFDKQVAFLSEDTCGAGRTASVWEHLLACVRFTESHLGIHKIPLTLHGDWNDTIGKFSQKGKGESVFAAQQYVVALRYLIELSDELEDIQCSKWLKDCLIRQEKAILECAWDGEWWIRGFDDDSNPIGSKHSEFGKLFLNSQSWAVLSGVGKDEQLKAAMYSVSRNLDTGIGIKKLTPGFKTYPEVSDPFTGYGPGCGENGAIFCHSNTWAIMAEAIIGNGTQAWKYFTQIIPHNALQKVGLQVYQAEPYAWVSNIVGPENPRFGWANVSQVTGTASWMDIAATQYLLGVRPVLKGICVNPCIPGDWKGFSISRFFRGTMVNIEVLNPEGIEKGIREITVDGLTIPFEKLPMIPMGILKGKAEVNVQITMGKLQT